MDEHKRDTATFVGSQAFFVMLGYGYTLIVGFPLQIFIARALGATELGYFSLIEAIIGVATGIMGLGVAATIVKFVPNHMTNREYSAVRTLVLRGTVIVIVSGMIAALGLIIARRGIADLITGEPGTRAMPTLVAIAAVLVPLGLILHLLQQTLRGFFDLRYAMIGSSIIQLTAKAVVAVVLISLGMKLMGLILAVIIAQSMAIAWMAIGVYQKLRLLPTDSAARGPNSDAQWRGYAVNQYMRFLSTLAVGYIDRFLLGAMAGASAVGVLSIVQQLQTLPAVCQEMLLTVVTPLFSAAHAGQDTLEAHRIFHLTTDWTVRAAVPVIIFFTAFSAPVLNLYGEAFAAAGTTSLCLVMLGQLVNFCIGPTTSFLNMTGREREFLRIHIAAQVVFVVCIAALVPWLSIMGAVIARFASSLWANVASLHVAKRTQGLQWWDDRYARWLLPAVVTTVTAVLLRLGLGATPGPIALIAMLFVVVATFHLVYLARGLSDDDRALLRVLSKRFGFLPAR